MEKFIKEYEVAFSAEIKTPKEKSVMIVENIALTCRIKGE
jgi:hypothetical protein